MGNDLFAPLQFARGDAMHNRFMLAPMTKSMLLSPFKSSWRVAT